MHASPVRGVGAPAQCVPLLLPTTCSRARKHSTVPPPRDGGPCLLHPTLAALAACGLLPVPHNACKVTAGDVKPGVSYCCFHSEVSLFPISLLLLCFFLGLILCFKSSFVITWLLFKPADGHLPLNRPFRKAEPCDHPHTQKL